MSDFMNHVTIKKTRKPHRCMHCDLYIPKGSKCELDTGVQDGDFYSHYQHTECRKEYCAINSESWHGEWTQLDEHGDHVGKPNYLSDWRAGITKTYRLSGSAIA